MKRVMIIGIPGSGKSTLARKLGEKLGIPYFYMDNVHHLPGWVKKSDEEFRRECDEIGAGDAWIADGNYIGKTVVMRERADTFIFLDYPRWYGMVQAVKRWAFHHLKVQKRADLAPGFEEDMTWTFLMWIWGWPKDSRVKWLTEFEKYPEKVITFKRRKDVNAWLNALPKQGR